MNADYRYVIAMEKYVALQKINKEEFRKELSSLDSITLTSLLACLLTVKICHLRTCVK